MSNENTSDFFANLTAVQPPKAKRARKPRATKAEQSTAPIPGTDPLLEGMNPEQAAAIQHTSGPLCVLAGAGSGKTRVLIHRVAYLIRSGVGAARILAVTFSKNAADEMRERGKALGLDAEFRTWHSLALHILKEDDTAWKTWKVDDTDRAKYLLKDVLGYKGMNWRDADLGAVSSFIGFCKSQLWSPTSNGAMDYAAKLGLPQQHAHEAYERYEQKLREERLLTFDDFLVHCHEHLRQPGVAERWASKWDHILQDEAQDANPAQLAIAKMLAYGHKNYMVVGDPAQCHPAGTMVRTPNGQVQIENLRDGDEVMGWNRNSGRMFARKIKIARRPYSGNIYDVQAYRHRSVSVTPNHRFVCRWTDRTSKVCVTYLMWREGFGFRVGWCKLFSRGGSGSNGFHLAQRSRIEKADAVWVLKVHDDRTDASVYESIVAAKYGLPTATFEPVHGATHQTKEAIARIFNAVGGPANTVRGKECLHDHYREFDLPLYPWPGTGKTSPQGRRTLFEVYASNLLPGVMSVPIPDRVNEWWEVDSVVVRPYKGDVWSLDVEKDHSYAANGIVVLNSIYKFRGSAPQFILSFKTDWCATVINMHRNYRCGSRIIDAANAVIRPSTQRLPTDITAEGGWEGVVTWRRPGSLEDEGTEVAGSIKEHVANGSTYSECAVLYRLNAQSRGIEEALLADKIPYVVVGGVSFYERKEVKDLLAYLRLIDGRSVKDSVKRAINAPFRFLGSAYLEKVLGCLNGGTTLAHATSAVKRACDMANVQQRQRASAVQFCGLLTECEAMLRGGKRPDEVLQHIVDVTQYEAWLKRDSGEESLESSHVSNVREMVRVATRFATVKELLDFVDATISDAKKNAEESKGKDRVVLMSIHKSKGLEFKHVHFVGACEMIIPHPRAEDIDEERRLAYVAITRAKQTLLVTSPAQIATKVGLREVAPSRFVVEAGLTGGAS